MKTRTKFLSLVFGTTISTTAIIAPSIALSSCSKNNDSGTGNNNQNDNGNNNGIDNNNQNGNNNQNETKPTPPLRVDTSNIRTFAQALSFAKDYLNKYYTFDMFKSDVIEYLKKANVQPPQTPAGSKSETIISNITTNPDKTVNFLYKIVSTSSPSTVETREFNCKNFNIVPIIVLDPNNKSICKIGIYIPIPNTIMLNPEQSPKPESDFIGPKNDYSIYTDNSKTYYGGWTQTIINIDQNKIHYVEYLDWSNRNPNDIGCAETFLLNVSFQLNLDEITNNLIRPL